MVSVFGNMFPGFGWVLDLVLLLLLVAAAAYAVCWFVLKKELDDIKRRLTHLERSTFFKEKEHF
ncbi:MAG: hypothetical protein JW834_01600 [Candidatus Diapherotrites archaeon]|nr:hypothetical protein [Candidatus Diapherotrites archaeon]